MKIVYDTGPVIFTQSCSFCHGSRANGDGPDASQLKIRPEDLSAVRANRSYLNHLMKEGVDGTGMPSFEYYSSYQRGSILDYLDKQYHIYSPSPPVSYSITSEEMQKANHTWDQTCSTCHGKDGQGIKLSAGFRPPPPNFTQYSLTPDRAFEVITKGYPNTQMSSYSGLPKGVRWGLVKLVLEKRKVEQP